MGTGVKAPGNCPYQKMIVHFSFSCNGHLVNFGGTHKQTILQTVLPLQIGFVFAQFVKSQTINLKIVMLLILFNSICLIFHMYATWCVYVFGVLRH